jgi:hypothetical protein
VSITGGKWNSVQRRIGEFLLGLWLAPSNRLVLTSPDILEDGHSELIPELIPVAVVLLINERLKLRYQ